MKKVIYVFVVAAAGTLAFSIAQLGPQPLGTNALAAEMAPRALATEADVDEDVPGVYPQATTRLLTEEDVQDLWAYELRIMRNEIYARHGYIFKDKEMREYFAAQSWYEGVSSNVDNKITPIEEQNIPLIVKHEEYQVNQEEEFMYFGR